MADYQHSTNIITQSKIDGNASVSTPAFNTHDADFYTWIQQQAALLRNGELAALDISNLIAELEDMGLGQRRELFLPFGTGGYILRYIKDGDTVVIVRAWHSKEQRA